MNTPVLINGVEYSAVDVKVQISGVPVFGISKISVAEDQEKTDYFALGSDRPVGRHRGQKKATGSMTLYPREIEAIQAGAPNKDILDVAAFDVSITAVPLNSDNTFRCVLKNVEFMRNARNFDIAQTTQDVELPIILSHVEWLQ
jgi:hypothetical protein